MTLLTMDEFGQGSLRNHRTPTITIEKQIIKDGESIRRPSPKRVYNPTFAGDENASQAMLDRSYLDTSVGVVHIDTKALAS